MQIIEGKLSRSYNVRRENSGEELEMG